jgi:serine phosphatase RsbU (regulator of sigma subunit)
MEPAERVGGDYYDVLQCNGKVKIGIGDVTGHGLESGVLMLMALVSKRCMMTSP